MNTGDLSELVRVQGVPGNEGIIIGDWNMRSINSILSIDAV